MLFIGLICYYFHVSGIAYNILLNYTIYLQKNIGCLFEMMPISVNGFIFNSKKLFLLRIQHSIFIKFFLFFILFILFKYDIFLNLPGFRYTRVSLNIISSFVLFLLFGALSFEKIRRKKYILLFINFITQFTGGIYYIHTIIRDFHKKYFFSLLKMNYSYSLIIYIISFFICFCGNKLFKNYKLK